jgi:hypothetical protein
MTILTKLFAVAMCGSLAACTVGQIDTRSGAKTGVDAGGSCTDGVRNGNELGIDCGGSCPNSCTDVFEPDSDALAIFELNGDVVDTSGHHRDATLIGGTFVQTAWGMGLALDGGATQGFEWARNAGLLVHPFTVEMVITPQSTACYKKLFGSDDTQDAGWYLCNTFESYPNDPVGGLQNPANHRQYLAVVSTSPSTVDIYIDGTKAGSTGIGFTQTGTAIFFRDDTNTNRTEGFAGIVEAVRISGRARTTAELAAIQTQLSAQP